MILFSMREALRIDLTICRDLGPSLSVAAHPAARSFPFAYCSPSIYSTLSWLVSSIALIQ